MFICETEHHHLRARISTSFHAQNFHARDETRTHNLRVLRALRNVLEVAGGECLHRIAPRI